MQSAECTEDGRPARAFHLTFDVETGELEASREVTEDLSDALTRLTGETLMAAE